MTFKMLAIPSHLKCFNVLQLLYMDLMCWASLAWSFGLRGAGAEAYHLPSIKIQYLVIAISCY